MFTRIGLLYHPRKPESLVLADQMADFLQAHGCQVWSGSAWDEPEALAHIAGLELLITLGGDGTILRAARIGSRHGVPILGVKLGRVSFLGEIPPENWQEMLAQMLAGHYWLEERMLLDVAVAQSSGLRYDPPAQSSGHLHCTERPGSREPERAPGSRDRAGAVLRYDPPPGSPTVTRPDHSYLALNDVVISRGDLARMVTVQTWVDHSYLTSYHADGIIVATPTGCTGYALAAGGPILPPELKNILLIPICPHLSLDRPVVLSQGAMVTLRVQADHPPILTVDGQFEITLTEGDAVEVHASEYVSRFVRMSDRAYFYRTLMERLRW